MKRRSRRAQTPRLFELALRVRAEDADETAAWLIERGAPGLEERPRGAHVEVVLYGEDEKSLQRLARAAKRECSAIRFLAIDVRNAGAALAAWRTAWTEHLTPRRLTRRLVAVPTTCDAPRGLGAAQRILLEPALAFGFGEHPTTRLAARAVEEKCRQVHVPRVLDVGAGSGILAFVAVLSGARSALGLDVDRAAVRAARRNADLNGLSGKCRFQTTPVARVRGQFDLVVANIRLAPLLDAAPAIARAVAPGGSLLLSGVLVEECRELERRYRELGLSRSTPRARRSEEGWALVALRRPPGLG